MTLGLFAACAPLPRPTAEQDATAGLAQPELVPIDAILAEAESAGVAEAAIDPMEARLAALRARADRLR
ncbi:MAG: hypothetical protein MUF74_03195 [Cypionkella sp.]|nr:hypothetical protein [Cypionkella sp.]